MRFINKLGMGVAAVSLLLSSCTKDFEELNTNPIVSPTTNPETLIVAAEYKLVDRDFEWFYDNYQYIMRWMQFVAQDPAGSANNSLFGANSNTNSLYNDLYNIIGRYTTQTQSIIDKLSAEEQAKYQNISAIAKVLKVYAAWRVSDANGSIPYTQAWLARDSSVFTPQYDSQSSLFDIWDAQLKAAVTTLSANAADQVGLGNAEMFYNGDAAKWAKAANVLRLKLAMRQFKRSDAKAKAIVADVITSTAGIFASNDDEWKFISAGKNFARSGNWNPDNGSSFVAAKNMVDFMYTHNDPRLRIFFKQNSYTQSVIDSLKNGGALSSGTTYNPRRYVGIPSSPDAKSNAAYARLYSRRIYSITLGGKTSQVTYDTLSKVQTRLFDLDQDGGGLNGGNGAQYTQPIASYAEMCFILAEFAERGVNTGGTAADWYNKGVTASLQAYDKIGSLAQVIGYSALGAEEITTYLADPAVAYTGTQEEKLEKIGVQNFLNLFKSPQEAWGSWKRTGYPKEGGILPFEPFMISGVKSVVPRRWILPIPSNSQENIPNYNAAISNMQKEGAYGEPNDLTGRVWWDVAN